MASSAVKTARFTDRFFLNVGNDSVVVIYESLRVPFRPADLAPGDTARIELEDTTGGEAVLKLYAVHDSLEILPLDTAITVSMLTITDTIVIRSVFIAQKPASHFLKLLREYKSFEGKAPDKMAGFSYADSSEASLVKLRKEFYLDSIAGRGDEGTRIINLLHWVHSTVRHNGSIESPPNFNAHELLAGALNENKGVNCGVLTEITNEVYLAMGFKSRRIVCLPYDTSDVDCHSINMVWSRHLGKWLYVDPTFEGMIRDSKGALLSIAEVREVMFRGDSLVINDNLNWNGQSHSKADYFRYISKNLFRFSCSSHSGPVERDQSKPLRWIHLNPTGYPLMKLGVIETVGTSGGPVTWIIDNDAEFWCQP